MAADVKGLSRQARSGRRRAAPTAWLRTAARVGLGARAVIYVMLGVLAAMIIANGRPPAQATGSGALAEIAKQPAGPFLLGLLAAGLICYAAWRLSQATAGLEAGRDRPSAAKRAGWLAIAAVYALLFAEAVSILMGSGTSGGPANHPQGAAATILSWPAGPILLGFVGAVLAVGAIALAIWACVHDYGEQLDVHRTGPLVRSASRITGTVGNVTRAALLALIASYTFLAAAADAPSREKSLDQSLEAILHSPGGPWWIALAATGLVAFGVSSILEAVYRRV